MQKFTYGGREFTPVEIPCGMWKSIFPKASRARRNAMEQNEEFYENLLGLVFEGLSFFARKAGQTLTGEEFYGMQSSLPEATAAMNVIMQACGAVEKSGGDAAPEGEPVPTAANGTSL